MSSARISRTDVRVMDGPFVGSGYPERHASARRGALLEEREIPAGARSVDPAVVRVTTPDVLRDRAEQVDWTRGVRGAAAKLPVIRANEAIALGKAFGVFNSPGSGNGMPSAEPARRPPCVRCHAAVPLRYSDHVNEYPAPKYPLLRSTL